MNEITEEDFQYNDCVMRHLSDDCTIEGCPICEEELDY